MHYTSSADNDKQHHTLLMAEDDPHDAVLFSTMLKQASHCEYDVVCVNNMQNTLDALQKNDYAALILDFNLSGTTGLENVRQISTQHPDLPIVVLTGVDDESCAMESLQLGVQDFLSKNRINAEIFTRSIKYALERKYIEQQLKRALDEAANRNLQLRELAKKDILTNLPNRSYFSEIAECAISRAEKSGYKIAVLYFDLNQFKNVNDTYGHSVGDQVLQTMASRVTQALRKDIVVARVGGDEFVVLVEQLEDGALAYSVAKKILAAVSSPIMLDRACITLSPSIGIATYPESESVDSLLRHAYIAKTEAKDKKDHFVHFYTKQLESLYQRQLAIEKQLPAGLTQKEFSLRFQPIVDSQSQRVIGMESLMRWHNRVLGHVPPNEFIPIAEWSDIIHQLTEFALVESLMLAKQFATEAMPLEKIAINVAAKQFCDNSFSKRFIEIAREQNVPLSNICIELTEGQIINNINQCRAQLEAFKSHGMKIALDDYGTGFSSITHLKQLPIDIIKIDRSLIDGLDNEPKNLALTAGIIEMAHRMNMTVVAEGIERPEEVTVLSDLGCDHLQGYFFGKPMTDVELVSMLSHQRDTTCPQSNT